MNLWNEFLNEIETGKRHFVGKPYFGFPERCAIKNAEELKRILEYRKTNASNLNNPKPNTAKP